MKIFLISNNLVLENIIYNSDEPLEQKRINRPLSIEGEKIAKKLSTCIDVKKIYSSDYASALATAKYLSKEKDIPIYIDSMLRDARIGELGNRSIKSLRLMQEKDLDYKFINGESLNETRNRMSKVVRDILKKCETESIAIFTHKRAILSYLLDYADRGFNLDDRLILFYDDKVILDDADKDMDIIEIELDSDKVKSINTIEI